MQWIKIVSVTLLLALSNVALAVDKNPGTFEDPEKEALFLKLGQELRCIVCPNQAIADSNSQAAQALRNTVRTMVERGDNEEEIKSALVARYDESILYRPPLNTKTLILWIAPGVVLLLALGLMIFFIRRHSRQQTGTEQASLSAEERARLDKLLKDSE